MGLCLIVASASLPLRDRLPKYLPDGFPVGVDLFVYTRAEFERLRENSPGWYQAIISGKDITSSKAWDLFLSSTTVSGL